ncbi:MAG: hypothetical protein U0M66_07010 [Bacilli bacterium]|nr:hypothetical protein [Bacilli bacterium]
MTQPINVSWNKTKKNVEEIITKYVYYNLSVDNGSSYSIGNDFFLAKVEYEMPDNPYVRLDEREIKQRVEFINYVRAAFNKLTSDERKIIYWTYLDKENNYDDRFIANNLGFSLGYYYIKKKETLIRFAYSLGVEELNG